MRLAGADALVRAHRRRNPKVAGEVRDQRLGQIVAGRDRVVVQPGVQLRRPDLVGAVDVDDVDQPQLPPGHRHLETLASAGAATSGRGRWWRITSSVGTSASTVTVMQRRSFCLARHDGGGRGPALRARRRTPIRLAAPTITARENTAYADRTDLSGKPFGRPRRSLVPAPGCPRLPVVRRRPAIPVSAVKRSCPSACASNRLQQACDRPLRLLRFRRHLASVTFSPILVKSGVGSARVDHQRLESLDDVQRVRQAVAGHARPAPR